MESVRRRNGEWIAVGLAAGLAFALAHLFLEDLDPYYPHRPQAIAALSAACIAWICWRIMVSNGQSFVAIRGGIAGAFTGFLVHPVYIVATGLVGLNDLERHVEYFGAALIHTFVVTSLLLPVTMTAGFLSGILAVLIGKREPVRQVPQAGISLEIRKPE